MNNKRLLQESFLSSVGVLIYIVGVAWVFKNGERLFGKMADFSGPILFLLLFIFSALITGLLVLGRPVWLYLEGEKKLYRALLHYFKRENREIIAKSLHKLNRGEYVKKLLS